MKTGQSATSSALPLRSTNQGGDSYFLHGGTTRTRKPRYFASIRNDRCFELYWRRARHGDRCLRS